MPEPEVKYMFEYDWTEGGIRGGGTNSGTVERDNWEDIIRKYKSMLKDKEYTPYRICLCVEIDLTEEDLI